MSNQLKEYRLQFGISQSGIATHLGIAKNTYFQYENGIRKVPIEAICRLADYYNVTVDELLGRSSAPQLFDNARVTRPEILELYDELTPAQQQNLLNYARGMAVSNTLEGESTKKQKRA